MFLTQTHFAYCCFQEASEKNVTIKAGSVVKKAADKENTTDNESLLSTSSNLEPFASDDLGEKTATCCH